MGDKWNYLAKMYPNDDDLTRVLHWLRYRDGQTCAKRATLVRHLRIPKPDGPGWSYEAIADVLGLTRNHTAKLAKTGASGTTAVTAMPINLASPGVIILPPSPLNSKGITGSEKTKNK